MKMPKVFEVDKDEIKNHTVYFGTSGKGKSLLQVRAQQEARSSGFLYVDTEMYKAGKGLLPYEHEYARRLALSINGRLPRELRGKRVTTVVSRGDIVRSGKTKMAQKHTVRASSGIILDRKLVGEARDQLGMYSGVWLKQPELITLMEKYGTDKMLAEFDEAETQIRERLMDALSMDLLGRSWPTCEALYNKADVAETGFADELYAAAKKAGYSIKQAR